MARLVTDGAELNSATAGIGYDTLTGSGLTTTTVNARSGVYCYKMAPSAATSVVGYTAYNADSARNGFARAYFYFTTLPSTANVRLIAFRSSTVNVATVQLSAANKLQLFNAAGAQVGSDSAVLVVNNWYRIELNLNSVPATDTIAASFVDCGPTGVDPGGAGTSIGSGNNSSNLNWSLLKVGLGNALNSGVCYVDDIALNDDTSGAAQTAAPGSGKIIMLSPNATGDANGFLVQIGGTAGSANNFSRVNEIPPDDATSYNASAVLNAEDLFNLTDSGLVNPTVSLVVVNSRLADLVAADATAGVKLEIIKTSGGTKTQSSLITPNSTTWVTNPASAGVSQGSINLANDPDATPWTSTTLDSMQIGYKETTANVRSIAVTGVWALVEYIPGAASSFIPRRALMGVGF